MMRCFGKEEDVLPINEYKILGYAVLEMEI
jgi:hypothetical protein